MAGSKISAATSGEPAVRADLVPVSRSTTSRRVTAGSIADLDAPIVVGGLGTTSTLTLKPTSGVGAAGADIIFQVGNNGATEVMRIRNNATINVGAGTDNGESFVVAKASGTVVSGVIVNGIAASDRAFLGLQRGAVDWDIGLNSISAGDNHLRIRQVGSTFLTIFTTGGIAVGAPTGGDLGAGTLNADNGIYIDNVLLLGAKDTSISSGLGTIKMKSANAADNAAWIPIRSSDGTVYFVPGWTTNNP